MPVEIKKDVYYAGSAHWDRKLFDELIPLPDGTSYNAYIIKGSEKTALIDAVDPVKEDELIENLKKAGVKKIDYIVSQHAEQDHSGGIPRVLKEYPEAKVATNEKCRNMLKDLLMIPDEKFITVADREKITLGNRTLEFILTPWVHWPETMSTYLAEDKVLFSCDFFGSHFATSDILNDEGVYEKAKRYYAEIMSPFRSNVRANIEKIKGLKIEMIAPSHGIIYKNPEKILGLYHEWSSENVKNEVILAYVSMHDSVKKMAAYLKDALIERGINVAFYNLTAADIGQLAMKLVDAASLVLGAPTVLAGIHPAAAYTAYLVNALRPKTKFISLVSSYGWGERASEAVKGMLTNFKGEMLAPVISKGHPKENEFRELDRLADDIAKKHREIGVLK